MHEYYIDMWKVHPPRTQFWKKAVFLPAPFKNFKQSNLTAVTLMIWYNKMIERPAFLHRAIYVIWWHCLVTCYIMSIWRKTWISNHHGYRYVWVGLAISEAAIQMLWLTSSETSTSNIILSYACSLLSPSLWMQCRKWLISFIKMTF